MPLSYGQAVKQNLDHMGTPAAEWQAVAVTGIKEADAGNGKSISMPEFDFPQGYDRAPSLFRGECCNLCGTSIKHVYWIQNDSKKWIMPVGSECVTHFCEVSGNALKVKARQNMNLAMLNEVITIKKAIWSAYSKRIQLTYGRHDTGIFPHSNAEREALKVYNAIKKCLGSVTADSGAAAITRWANKSASEASRLAALARQVLELKSS